MKDNNGQGKFEIVPSDEVLMISEHGVATANCLSLIKIESVSCQSCLHACAIIKVIPTWDSPIRL